MTAENDLAAIRARDASSGALWFTGPESFTALAARDRRALLAEIDRLSSLVRLAEAWTDESLEKRDAHDVSVTTTEKQSG
jgi:hypothetical protein